MRAKFCDEQMQFKVTPGAEQMLWQTYHAGA